MSSAPPAWRQPTDFSAGDKPAKRTPYSVSQTHLRSIPVAQVFLDEKNLGFTPLCYPGSDWQEIDYKAKGYLGRLRSTHRPKREYLAQLVRPGYLTLRATPAASSIMIDETVYRYLKAMVATGKHREARVPDR